MTLNCVEDADNSMHNEYSFIRRGDIMNMLGNTDLLTKALDASWLKGEMISNNIANADTPNYKRKDVAFEAYLQQALDSNGKIDEDKLSNIKTTVYQDNSNLSYRLDGNNVDIDTEMGYLAQNQIQYSTLISQVNYNFSRLRMVLGK